MIDRRDIEEEARDILQGCGNPTQRLKLGTLLAEIGRKSGLSDEDFAVFDQVRDKGPAEPLKLDSNSPND